MDYGENFFYQTFPGVSNLEVLPSFPITNTIFPINNASAFTPNFDTLYAVFICDRRHGSVTISTPTFDRFYNLNFFDDWGFLVKSYGIRKNGLQAQTHTLSRKDQLYYVLIRVAVDFSDPSDVSAGQAQLAGIKITGVVKANPYRQIGLDPKTSPLDVKRYLRSVRYLDRRLPRGLSLPECSELKTLFAEFSLAQASIQSEINYSFGWLESSASDEYETNPKKYAVDFWGGPYANLKEDAVYYYLSSDLKGNQYSGTNKYTLTLTEFPQYAEYGFWSLTLYNSLTGFPVQPPILINSYNITSVPAVIQIQNTPPSSGIWLPSVISNFSLIFRIYLPTGKFFPPLPDRG
ncbi:MAG: DUF1214 domain-containing protein [Nitrososphaerales archaeon]